MAFRILIVDDEPAVLEFLSTTLRAEGYETAGASTFEEGKRLLLATAPDVLITDVRLGHFNGLQLVVMRPAATAAVVVSGFWDRTLDEEARRQGAVYLLKPIAPDHLIRTVRQVLQRQHPPAGV